MFKRLSKKEKQRRNKEACAIYRQETREKVLEHYSEGKMECACCTENIEEFLCIDHIDGGGNVHRAEIGHGTSFYRWLINNDFPLGYQVLCHNCNLAKGFYGKCPHEG